jgi:hypothetical protein
MAACAALKKHAQQESGEAECAAGELHAPIVLQEAAK